MKCPHCNHEIEDGLDVCPDCGEPIVEAHPENQEPRLSLFTKIFIIVGIVALAALSWIYYEQHKNDPAVVRTAIEPDSALAEHFAAQFDTMAIDTAAIKEQQQEEKAAAEKVLNSIRHSATTESQKTETTTETTEPTNEAGEPSGEIATPSEPAAPVEAAPTPKVEVLE